MPPKKSSKKASKKPEKEEETKTETEQETAAQSETAQSEVKAQPANPPQATTTQKAPESTTAAPTTQTQSNGTKEDGDDKGQAHGVVNLKGDTPQKDIMKLRQFRFGSNSSNVLDTASAKEMAEAEDKKRKDRLKKFGLPDPDDEAEKKKQRALKFGLPVEATPAEEEAKREERRKKFGILPENQGTVVDDEKIKARVARFGAVGNDDNKLGGGPRKQRKFN